MTACMRCHSLPAVPGHRFCGPCGREIHAGNIQRSGLCMNRCGRIAKQGHRYCIPCGSSFGR
ncbi:hypothetical protein CORC01_05290 [Colletotrichum orchidophilum]|uniref:DZANK-type domain-containing protein n=1 Tax=Colletotrichum orchidophilum TaxID=1209926 RepID=A0A1G4BDM7_9PEZI|nr:uncharacterized protein CORC01_05290 [Colletotrichum orchidophilum]OHE99490.1 hypothetical protein CORC01_05290 [Colletotrichum orchidophilum]